MATTGILNGHNLRWAIGDATTNTVIAKATTGSINITSNSITVSHKDTSGGTTGWESAEYGTKSWNGSITVYKSEDDTEANAGTSWDSILRDMTAGTKISVIGTTGVSGDTYYLGDAVVTDYSEDWTDGELVTVDISFNGDGELTQGVLI